jgi:hypothetical protein
MRSRFVTETFTCSANQRQSETLPEVRGSPPSYRSSRERSPDVFCFHAQRCSHLAEPLVFISQQSDGVRDILGAAQIRTLDLWLVVGRTLCEFESHGCPTLVLGLPNTTPTSEIRVHVIIAHRRFSGQEDVRARESAIEDLKLRLFNQNLPACEWLDGVATQSFAAESICYKPTAEASACAQLTTRLGALGLDVIVDEDFICPQ